MNLTIYDDYNSKKPLDKTKENDKGQGSDKGDATKNTDPCTSMTATDDGSSSDIGLSMNSLGNNTTTSDIGLSMNAIAQKTFDMNDPGGAFGIGAGAAFWTGEKLYDGYQWFKGQAADYGARANAGIANMARGLSYYSH